MRRTSRLGKSLLLLLLLVRRVGCRHVSAVAATAATAATTAAAATATAVRRLVHTVGGSRAATATTLAATTAAATAATAAAATMAALRWHGWGWRAGAVAGAMAPPLARVALRARVDDPLTVRHEGHSVRGHLRGSSPKWLCWG